MTTYYVRHDKSVTLFSCLIWSEGFMWDMFLCEICFDRDENGYKSTHFAWWWRHVLSFSYRLDSRRVPPRVSFLHQGLSWSSCSNPCPRSFQPIVRLCSVLVHVITFLTSRKCLVGCLYPFDVARDNKGENYALTSRDALSFKDWWRHHSSCGDITHKLLRLQHHFLPM